MSVKIDLSGLKKLTNESARKKRQAELAQRAAFGMRKFVPVEEGTLRASEPLNSRYDEGKLIWNTPYANYQYERPMTHTQAGTTDHWDEAYMQSGGAKDLAAYADTMYGDLN